MDAFTNAILNGDSTTALLRANLSIFYQYLCPYQTYPSTIFDFRHRVWKNGLAIFRLTTEEKFVEKYTLDTMSIWKTIKETSAETPLFDLATAPITHLASCFIALQMIAGQYHTPLFGALLEIQRRLFIIMGKEWPYISESTVGLLQVNFFVACLSTPLAYWCDVWYQQGLLFFKSEGQVLFAFLLRLISK